MGKFAPKTSTQLDSLTNVLNKTERRDEIYPGDCFGCDVIGGYGYGGRGRGAGYVASPDKT